MPTGGDTTGSIYYNGQYYTPEQLHELGVSVTGANTNPAAAIWKGAQRPEQWQPPEFLQTYGNYTGLFPSMGQQVGQSLYGSIQARPYSPAWMQTMLPPRQSRITDYAKYSPFQTGMRAMNNPYPLNGKVDITTPRIGQVDFAGNPFIGTYTGLGGTPGGGSGGGGGGGGGGGPPPPNPPPPPGPPPNPFPPPGPPPPPGGGQTVIGTGQNGYPQTGTPTGSGNPFGTPYTPYTGQAPYPPPPPYTGQQQPTGSGFPGQPMTGVPTAQGGQFGTPYTPQTGGTSPYPPPSPMSAPAMTGLGGQQPATGLPSMSQLFGLAQSYGITPQMVSGLLGSFGGVK
jgi:hypothetical protein